MLSVVFQIINAITLVLAYGGVVLGIFCVVDAVARRADAFVAADKQTKGVWLGITIASAVVLGLGVISPALGPQSLLWLAAMVGVLLYLCDVRPRLKQISGPHRW